MMVGPGIPPHDSDVLDELAAIAALEGLGVLSERQRALVDEERVSELEHAAGALFTALGGTRTREAPDQMVGRLESLLASQTAAEARPIEASLDHDPVEAGVVLAGPGSAEASPSSVSAASGSSAGVQGLQFSVLAGWMAAAALLLTTVLVYGRVSALEARLGLGSSESLRSELIATAPDVEVLPWATEGVTGDVTWSDVRNEGFLRIAGLGVNDPAVSQYQLWIFRGLDPDSEPHPVSGGVFDVLRDGEVVIPIDAQLELGRAGIFAVTVEAPGGVMVSERENIVLVASRA